MFYIINRFIRFFIFYLLLFSIHRSFFCAFHFNTLTKKGVWMMLRSFYEALPLDISAACYFSAFSLLFILPQFWLNKKIFFSINKFFLYLFIFLLTLIAVTDIIVYREMNVKIHFKLLYHLKHPQEVIQSVNTFVFIAGMALIAVFTWLYGKWMVKFSKFNYPPDLSTGVKSAVTAGSVSILGLMIGAGIRGGFQQIPINESQVYYTSYQPLNDAAVNPAWTLMHSYLENIKYGNTNPYIFMPMNEADTRVKKLYAASDSSFADFLKTERPNIAYIILEGWTADVVNSCGGINDITPQFDSLAKKGILFSNAYASGQLSHQGIPAILSSYPSQPVTDIIQNREKYQHIPCINHELAKNGYNSSFYFGGQLIYGNLRGYLLYNQFNEVKEQKDYSVPRHLKNKLGIHDEFMFNEWLQALNKKQEPFFSCLFTVSTHSPYVIPMKEKIHYGGGVKPYFNSVVYSDSCLGDFFRKAEKQPWYQNTLFVIVADHSHYSPKGHAASSPEHNHIPLLLYGDVLKDEYRARNFTHVASQTDITATLLRQMKIPHQSYQWSKNLFDTAHAFAFYSFYNGYGMVSPKGNVVWDKKAGGKYITNTFTSADSVSWRLNGEAYLQKLFQEYLDF